MIEIDSLFLRSFESDTVLMPFPVVESKSRFHYHGNRHFWAREYFVDTVGRNKKAIKAYIQNQLEEDKMSDQISIKEFVDPFTGSKNPKA